MTLDEMIAGLVALRDEYPEFGDNPVLAQDEFGLDLKAVTAVETANGPWIIVAGADHD